MMNVVEAIRKRRSIRKYINREIEEDKLNRILEAARLAPSARNLQDWRFIVVRDLRTREKLSAAAKGQSFIAEAPVVIAACGTNTDYVMTCGQHSYTIDVAIALDHVSLAAVEESLGTCWIGAFFEDKVKEILGVPDNVRVVALMPIGYPAEQPLPTKRKPIEEVVASDRWT